MDSEHIENPEVLVPEGERMSQPQTHDVIVNPYRDRAARWLKGEIHTHVDRDDAGGEYSAGVAAPAIYAAANGACLDFVCMSVDATQANGAGRFGDVGAGSANGVIGIPGREIQNNFYSPEHLPSGSLEVPEDDDYFPERGADYLHVLTIGETAGISICLHPRYYELVKVKAGGCWTDIKSALLNPHQGGNLARLDVSGIEIYNGFTLDRLRRKGKECKYSEYDEFCWDELLMEGRTCWGFAGNDSFFHKSDTFDSFAPLGVVYAASGERASAAEIVKSLKRGRFYSSTGIKLSDEPIRVETSGSNLRIDVSANTAVDWTAKVLQLGAHGWCLNSQHVLNTSQATFEIGPKFKYVRIRCQCVRDSWQRAWLQPLINQNYFR